jgi:trans-aconitate methyltransferase
MNKTHKTNTWNASEYAQFSKGQKKWADELIAKLDIQPNDSILDIGCGDGKITAQMAAATHGRVIGIDKDPGMIALASQRYPEANFHQMDAEVMTFEDTFSIVFSNAALHWAHDHRAILAGIYRALKPGGRALLQFGGHGNAEDIFAIMTALIQEEKYRNHFHDFIFPWFFPRQAEYEQLLSTAEFSHATVTLIHKEMTHETIQDFQGWLRTTWFPYIHRIPHEKQDDFVNDITNRCIDAFGMGTQGSLRIKMVRIEVSAQK